MCGIDPYSMFLIDQAKIVKHNGRKTQIHEILLNSGAKCDNCCKGKQEQKDITQFARKLVDMVARLAMRGKFMEKNFTVNHLVDILRESKNKKVTTSNWNSDPFYGSGKYSCKV